MAKGTTAVYLYCVVRAARKPALGRLPSGLAGATRPAAHRLAGSLWLITANVPLDVYSPQHLEARLRDLEWVSEAAIRHESVVEHCARGRGAVVIPMKLFTMFSSMEKAVEEVGHGRATIERAMKHIAGSEEWGIRIARKPGAPSPAAPGRTSRPASGAAFLTARKEARDATASLRMAALAAADAAFDRLGRHAKDARRRERRQEPGANPPVLEAAFLVAAGARARFKAEARRQAAACAAAGAELILTGPWPAYNFVASEGRA
jgi:gas vesicle protein GvpL/GvpF